MFTRLLCAVLLILTTVLPAEAADRGADGQLKQVAQLIHAYNGITHLSADFVQTSRFAGFSTVRTFKGQLQLTRPDKMRWDYREGSQQQIYVNGHQVTVYAPASKQAIISQLTPASDRQIPLHLLADVTGIEDTYRVEPGPTPNELVLTLRQPDPKAPTGIQLWLDPASHLIARVKLSLPGGSESDIRFSHMDGHAQIDPDRYRFTAPKGVYVARPDSLFPSAR